jgi:hypothetical protein
MLPATPTRHRGRGERPRVRVSHGELGRIGHLAYVHRGYTAPRNTPLTHDTAGAESDQQEAAECPRGPFIKEVIR